MRLLVTGASGFIGRGVVAAARAAGHEVRRAVRGTADDADAVGVGEIGAGTDWRAALDGIECVIHLAARVHVMRETARDPLALFRWVNVEGSEALARQCAASRVRRLVFVSTIKVNGEATTGRSFTETDPPDPQDPYARSKHEAELALERQARETGLEVTIIRPTLVLGPGAGGNLRRLLQLLDQGVPLPLGGLGNRRSLVQRDALAALLLLAAAHPAAANETFLAAEEPALSTTELIELLASGLGQRARLLPLPALVARALARLPRVGPVVARLTGSLEVDASKARTRLGWRSPTSLADGIVAMAGAYRAERAEGR